VNTRRIVTSALSGVLLCGLAVSTATGAGAATLAGAPTVASVSSSAPPSCNGKDQSTGGADYMESWTNWGTAGPHTRYFTYTFTKVGDAPLAFARTCYSSALVY